MRKWLLQKTAGYAFLAFLLSGIASCIKPPCTCDPISTQTLTSKIVDRQGRNLVFGPASSFSTDSIKVLENAADFSVHNAAVSQGFADTSTLVLHFYVPAQRSYLYFNRQTASDTLEIDWESKAANCCSEPFTYSDLGRVTFNGATVTPQNGIYYLVK